MIDLCSKLERPDRFGAEELDAFLAAGWRPMGQSIYTSHFSQFNDGRIYSTLCTRLPLHDHRFGKSRRKLLRRNDRQFQCVVRPARLTPRKRIVNRRYEAAFPHRHYPTLEFHLYNDEGTTVFDTQELEVYAGDRLVAFSFFDLGRNSIYSKIGIYDPALRQSSLGLYTMLKEIEWGMEHHYAYYYPGYVAPGYPEFDYKHRVGPLQFLDLAREQWRPFADLKEEDIPIRAMEARLQALAGELRRRGVDSRLFFYPHFDLNLVYDLPSLVYLSYPVFLLLHRREQPGAYALVVYDFATQRYERLRCRFLSSLLSGESADSRYFDPIVLVKETCVAFPSESEMADWECRGDASEKSR